MTEIERLRAGEVPMLGAAVVRDAAGPGALEVVARYETTTERGVLRALRELRDLQATRSRS